MRTAIIALLKWSIVLFAVAIFGVWAVLAAPFFSEFRKSIVGGLLSEEIGQVFVIDGDVKVSPGLTTRVHISGARVPSTTLQEITLAELKLMELDVDVPALFGGRPPLDNLTIEGLSANLLTARDGTTSWIKRAHPAQAVTSEDSESRSGNGEDTPSPSIYTFLSDKTVSFSNITLLVENRQTGFVFDFALDRAALEQLQNGDLVSLTGEGSVNDQVFSFTGEYPANAPFTNVAKFGDIELTYDGSLLPASEGGGYTATLALDTGEIGAVFDVLRLQRSLEGTGKINAVVTSRPGVLQIDGLVMNLLMKQGQVVTVEGKIENLVALDGIDIKANARLHPEGQPPARAEKLKELKLTQINALIVGEDQSLEFEELIVNTNAFNQGLERVGPVRIGRIYRTEEGTLGFEGVHAQVGPVEAPFIVAEGSIGDIFAFEQVELSGRFQGSANAVLKSLSEEDAAQFGGLEAKFTVSDNSGALGLTSLEARSVKTDLWTFGAEIAIEDVTKLDGTSVELVLEVQETFDFLSALGLEGINIGRLGLDFGLKGGGQTAEVLIGFLAGESDLSTHISFDLSQEIDVVRGTLISERMRLEDISNGIKTIRQMTSDAKAKQSDENTEAEEEVATTESATAVGNDGLLDPDRLLKQTDLEITMEIREFIGEAGTSSMSSTFVAKEGQLEAGPFELSYGDGQFKVTAFIDAVERPDIVRIKGNTSGWDLGKILKGVGVDIEASGTLTAWFDVSGNTEVADFVDSLVGSAKISMGRGSVATSLLELAGLGIFPWLFSDEFAEGRTEIVCVSAPVALNRGNVKFDAVVAETQSVQLVARGEVDWKSDQITIRAEPRRVGEPLSRSAWPFNVTGKLSEPEFKLDVGGSRSRRADGADQMPAERTPCEPDIMQLE